MGDVAVGGSLEGIDWKQAKADLAADRFDNGRSADVLRLSFEQSQHVAFARDGDRIVGMARLLSEVSATRTSSTCGRPLPIGGGVSQPP